MINFNDKFSDTFSEVANSIKVNPHSHSYIVVKNHSIEQTDAKIRSSSMKEIANFIINFNDQVDKKEATSLEAFKTSFTTIKNYYDNKHAGLFARLIRVFLPSARKEYRETTEAIKQAEQKLQSIKFSSTENTNEVTSENVDLTPQRLQKLDQVMRETTRENKPENSNWYQGQKSIDLLSSINIVDYKDLSEEYEKGYGRKIPDKWSQNPKFLVIEFDRKTIAQGGKMNGPSDLKMAMLRYELSQAGIEFDWQWVNDTPASLCIPLENDVNRNAEKIEALTKVASSSMLKNFIQRLVQQQETLALKGWGLIPSLSAPKTIKAETQGDALAISFQNFHDPEIESIRLAFQEVWPEVNPEVQKDKGSPKSGKIIIKPLPNLA